jgi:hypothetical protein
METDWESPPTAQAGLPGGLMVPNAGDVGGGGSCCLGGLTRGWVGGFNGRGEAGRGAARRGGPLAVCGAPAMAKHKESLISFTTLVLVET